MTHRPTPLFPNNETQRLARLHELMVLDTDAEPVFDHLVAWASEVCGVPIALVSLVDEGRQWFKAQTGLPGVSETPRDRAFCAHAILGDGLFEVPDATTDPRFSANPLVTGEPGVRFYAGAPLTLPGGERIGTLCVIDRQPRTLNAVQADTLQRLAQAATHALVMRRNLIQRALTARHDDENALRASEAQHRSIVEDQSELVSLARSDGTLVYANPAYARHFGLSADQVVGRNLHDFIDPAERPLVKDRIDWVLGTGEPIVGENRMLHSSGEALWVAWTLSLQRQGEGEGEGERWVRSVGRDVSARRRAESALRSSQQFLQRTGRVAGVGGWQLDLLTDTVTWSEQTRRIHEVPASFQPSLAAALDFYVPEARLRLTAAVDQAIAGGGGWDLELPMRTAQGRPIWVRAVGEAEFEAGQPVRLIGAVQDITARKALEERIAESERFVREVTDNLAVRIAYVDRDGRHQFVNEATCERFGIARDQILGRTRAELLGGPDDPVLVQRSAAALRGQAQQFEFEELVRGQRLRIESRLRPDVDANGDVRGYFATGVDVTERSRDEQALRVLTTILDKSTDLVLQSGPRGELLYMNPAARRVVGLAADAALQDRHVTEFNTPETNRLIIDELLPAVRRDGVWRGETNVRSTDGSLLPVSHLAIAHRDETGRLLRYSTILRDISAEVAQRQDSQRQAATLRSVTDALPVIVAAVDTALRFRLVNNAFEQWHGLVREQVLGRSAAELLADDDVESARPAAQRALDGEAVHFERHYPARAGQPTLSLSYIPVRLDDGRIDGFVVVAFDITPHRQEQVRLQSLAERDSLTGCLNRSGLQAWLTRLLLAGQGADLALLYIDLDWFKPVNDTHGHATGDALLQAFAQRLVRLVRPTDAVARLGGDEFAVLLAGVRDTRSAELVAAKVVDAAREPFDLGSLVVQVGASVGVALGADSADGGASLLARADAQLYRAKQAGRGRLSGEATGSALRPD